MQGRRGSQPGRGRGCGRRRGLPDRRARAELGAGRALGRGGRADRDYPQTRVRHAAVSVRAPVKPAAGGARLRPRC
eukprot:scaffold3460_cov115-Isochrysis_galbana.AAC.14